VVTRLPEPEFRRFDGHSGLRQWLALPSTQWTPGVPWRHGRRGFLVEFDCGAVAFVRMRLEFRWTDDRMRTAARMFGDLTRTVQPDLGCLALHLGDALDTSVDIATPVLASSNLELWEVRKLALHHVTSEALAPRPLSGWTEGSGALEDRLERLVEHVRGELIAGIESFRSGLHPDAVRHATSPKGVHLHAYNRLAAPFGTANRNRIQFAETFPIFMQGLLAENPPYDNASRYLNAIDRGEPATPILMSTLGVRASTIRFLVGKSPIEIGWRWVKAPGRLAALLDTLPPELRPRDESTWSDFNEIVRAHWGGALPEVSALLLRTWLTERHRRSARTHELPTDLKVDPTDVRDIGDLYSSLKRCLRVRAEIELGLSEGQSGSRARELADSALKGRSWSTLASLARHWQACVHADPIPAATNLRHSANRFAALLPRPWTIDGVSIVSLNTEAALQEEAEAMHHCVDTYVDECQTGESFIVSLREERSGARLSTAEFRLVREQAGPIRLLERQHAGLFNAQPPAAAVDAIDALQRSAEDPELQRHWGRILRAIACSRLSEVDDESRLERIAPEEAAFRGTLKPVGAYDRLLRQPIVKASVRG
jgi:hypothetical protein